MKSEYRFGGLIQLSAIQLYLFSRVIVKYIADIYDTCGDLYYQQKF